MKSFILGTAGHIDHGKTALVLALTGVDCDRLPEEKARGITIELGFAPLDLPGGIHAGIVDVPGHERFVKTMVAGAQGVDLVMLVVAVDEGVKPQTIEHLEICSLLGVKRGVVALTKCDLADSDLRAMASEEVAETVRGTFLEGAPIVEVSARSREGLDRLKEVLAKELSRVESKPAGGPTRLPVDRAFVVKGFGVVVTGTLLSGEVRTGDPVVILPSGREARVRGVQVHDEFRETSRAGERTALNLQGVTREEVERGDVVASPGAFQTTRSLEAEVEMLADAASALAAGRLLSFHLGTAQAEATLSPIGREEIAPGERGFARVRLDAPLVAVRADRFVVRDPATNRTVGGGAVLDPAPPSRRRVPAGAEGLPALEALAVRDTAAWIEAKLARSAERGASPAALRAMAALDPATLREILDRLVRQRKILWDGQTAGLVLHASQADALSAKVLRALGEFHRASPMEEGMPRESLRRVVSRALRPEGFAAILGSLVRAGRVLEVGKGMRLASHVTRASDANQHLVARILERLGQGGLGPPTTAELAEALGAAQKEIARLLDYLVSQGKVVKVKTDLYFDASAIGELEKRMISHLLEKGEISTLDFKAMTGVSRKFAIPLAEYLDSIHVTIRVGEVRKLRKAPAA